MFSCGHDTDWLWIERVPQPTPPGQQQQPAPRKTVAKDGTGKKPSPGSDHAAPDPPVPPPAPDPPIPSPVPPPAPAGSDACTVRTTRHEMKYTHRLGNVDDVILASRNREVRQTGHRQHESLNLPLPHF